MTPIAYAVVDLELAGDRPYITSPAFVDRADAEAARDRLARDFPAVAVVALVVVE